MPSKSLCSNSDAPKYIFHSDRKESLNNTSDREEKLHNTFDCVGAIIADNIKTFEELIRKGVLINGLEENPYYPKLIFVAQEYKRLEMIKILLDRGAKINDTDFEGWTVLMEAAYLNHFDIAKLLIDRKANVNIVDRNGNSALSIAASKGNTQIMTYLLESGADKNLVNFKQRDFFEDNLSVNEILFTYKAFQGFTGDKENTNLLEGINCTENNLHTETVNKLIAEVPEEYNL